MFDIIPVEVALVALVILLTYAIKNTLVKDKDGIINIPFIKKQLPVKELIVYIPFILSAIVSVLSNLNAISNIGDFVSQVTKDTAVISASAMASYSLVIKKLEVFIMSLFDKKEGDCNDKQDKTDI